MTHALPTSGLRMPHAVIMMLLIMAAAVALTYVIPSGSYERTAAGLVVPGTYHVIPKDISLASILEPHRSTTETAYPASPVSIFASIPAGMAAAASLIFMIVFIGGMFGVLRETGALDAGVERLLAITHGNIDLLAPVLMIAIASGSTFLGLISEYLIIIPMMVVLAEKLGLDRLFALAVVAIAAKIGYMTSVTNPLPLVIAQPIVGVPSHERLPARHVAVLASLLLLVGAIIYGAQVREWGNIELGGLYIAAAFVIALIGRMKADDAASSFLKGMKTMMLAALLVGLARAVELILRDGMILDSMSHAMARAAEGQPPIIVAQIMVFIQMALDVFIPSTSGQAAVTMPVLGPIAQLSGLSGQVAVQAFIFGNGLTNTITPTSGMLLAYLATADVPYGRWVRFVFPAGPAAARAVADRDRDRGGHRPLMRAPAIEPFTIHEPDGTTAPVVFDSPHSGRHYPADFAHACTRLEARRGEDAYVDELTGGATAAGIPVLVANYPRCYIDLNRDADDIDPALLDGPWPTPLAPTEKSRRGLGLIRRFVTPGVAVHDPPIAAHDVRRRIDAIHGPWHHALAGLLERERATHGFVWHIDWHSMKSVGNAMTPDGTVERPDFVLGDLDGRSATADVTALVVDGLRSLGYRVAINDPYRGGSIVRRSGDPRKGIHSIQVEVKRSLYLDEAAVEKTAGFPILRDRLTALANTLADAARARARQAEDER